MSSQNSFLADNIGQGFMGNGHVIWDRSIVENSDFKKVAFIQGKPNARVMQGDDVQIYVYQVNERYDKELISYIKQWTNSMRLTITETNVRP